MVAFTRNKDLRRRTRVFKADVTLNVNSFVGRIGWSVLRGRCPKWDIVGHFMSI